MNYLDITKSILDNFVFTTINVKDFYWKDDILIAGNSQRFFDYFDHSFYNVNGNTFHNSEFINFLKKYKKPRNLSLNTAFLLKKKIILEVSFHPCSDSEFPHQIMKTHFFDKLLKDDKILKNMQDGNLFLLLNQGWEPQNFTEQTRRTDTIKNYYELFQMVIKEYNLPENSIIPMGGNVRGYEYEQKYDFKYCKINSIFDTFMEVESFKSIPDEPKLDLNYTFDEHLENIKKSENKLLRISRTPNALRNIMLYYLYKNNFTDDSIIEHTNFSTHGLENVFDVDKTLVNKIKNDIPLIASKLEGNKVIENYSNEVIPYDVYKNSIFTWCSTSLPEQIDRVYLSQSTFNPMLFYHPIVWHSQPFHIEYLKKFGYKSYDWLNDESSDLIEEPEYKTNYKKMKINFKNIENLMNMDRNTLIDTILENRSILEHNRKLLIQCNSIERIIKKFYEIVYETKV